MNEIRAMSLFDVDIVDPDRTWLVIKSAQKLVEGEIREELEALWRVYAPYADTDFRQNFARDLDARFWEMYLTVQLLKDGKDIRPRC